MESSLYTFIIVTMTTIVSSLVSFVLTRKKYRASVTATQIDNNTKQLEFYILLLKDYREQLKIYVKSSEETRQETFKTKQEMFKAREDMEKMKAEVVRLSGIMDRMANDVCTVRDCENRHHLDKTTLDNLIDGGKNYDVKTTENS